MNRKCDAGFLIKQIHDALSKRFNDVLKKYDLTISQMYVLKYLRENQNKMVTQKEIEQYLEVSHPTTVGILKRLESKGFIQTEIIKEGRFSKQVVLTEKSKCFTQELSNGTYGVRKKASCTTFTCRKRGIDCSATNDL